MAGQAGWEITRWRKVPTNMKLSKEPRDWLDTEAEFLPFTCLLLFRRREDKAKSIAIHVHLCTPKESDS